MPDYRYLYESLKGTRMEQGQLSITGFETEADYQELYYTLLEELAPVIHDNYPYWFNRQLAAYYRFNRAKSRSYQLFDPFQGRECEQMTVREQLVVLKFYLYRRYYSSYKTKGA